MANRKTGQSFHRKPSSRFLPRRETFVGSEPGRVVPRAEILEQLWGYPPRRAADLRVVDVYVARLRGKLEPDPRNPELILTVRGTGYASQRVGDGGPAALPAAS